MFDPECEIGEKIELMTALGTAIESWVKYRNLWSLFCLYNALRLLGKVYWARKFSVLLVTIRTAANQLGYFFLLLGGVWLGVFLDVPSFVWSSLLRIPQP